MCLDPSKSRIIPFPEAISILHENQHGEMISGDAMQVFCRIRPSSAIEGKPGDDEPKVPVHLLSQCPFRFHCSSPVTTAVLRLLTSARRILAVSTNDKEVRCVTAVLCR